LTARDLDVINRVFGTSFASVAALAPTLTCRISYRGGGADEFRVDDDPELRRILGSAARPSCGCDWVPFPPTPARVVKLVKTDGTVVQSTSCPASES
jgi:hypothetical protein